MKELYEKYTTNYLQSADYSVAFFNNHQIIFNNVNRFTTELDLRLFMEVYYSCLNALEKKAQHNNVIDSTTLVFPVIEQAIDEFKIDRSKFDFYKWLIFLQASAYYYLKDYINALKIFEILHQYEPESDAFDLWIENCKTGKIKRYIIALWIFSGCICILSFINKALIPVYIRLPFLLLGLLTTIAAISLETYSNRKRRKIKLKRDAKT